MEGFEGVTKPLRLAMSHLREDHGQVGAGVILMLMLTGWDSFRLRATSSRWALEHSWLAAVGSGGGRRDEVLEGSGRSPS